LQLNPVAAAVRPIKTADAAAAAASSLPGDVDVRNTTAAAAIGR